MTEFNYSSYSILNLEGSVIPTRLRGKNKTVPINFKEN